MTSIAKMLPTGATWQGPEIESLVEVATLGELDEAELVANHTVLAALWLHERGWWPIHHAAVASHRDRVFVCPEHDVIAVVDLECTTAPPPPDGAVLDDRLRHLGLGALADTAIVIEPRTLTVDPLKNRVHERIGAWSSDAPLASPGQRKQTTIGDGSHASVGGNYGYRRTDRNIHVSPITVHVPGADPDEPNRQWMLDAALRPALDNPTLGDDERQRLRAALQTIALVCPDAMGLVGSGNYSGLNASSLTSTLAHGTRARAFGHELATAAALAAAPSLSDDGRAELQLRPGYERVDFGVRFALGGPRRSIEADLLITTHEGLRHGVDVKYTTSRSGHPTRLSRRYLDGIVEVLQRGELDWFHVIANTWVRPGNVVRLGELVDVGHNVAWHSQNPRSSL